MTHLDERAVVQQQFQQFRNDFELLRREIGKVIVGQTEIVEGTLTALIAGGHVLLEGVPGLGKTLLVRTLADALDLQFQRVQFTPDLMPADLTGTNIVVETAERQRKFEFQKGPVFCNLLLADEVNRATPKTQSALLEAMQEQSVTVAGRTYELPRPFLVMATQNPLEMEGTYPLPEAQLDRFFLKLLVRFPQADELAGILERTTDVEQPRAQAVVSGARILEMHRLARQVLVSDAVKSHAIELVLATHPDNDRAPETVRRFVQYGCSPRGAQALILAAKIRAILDRRYHVACDDLHAVAPAALRHRLILSFEGQAHNIRPDDVIADVLDSVTGSADAELVVRSAACTSRTKCLTDPRRLPARGSG